MKKKEKRNEGSCRKKGRGETKVDISAATSSWAKRGKNREGGGGPPQVS